MDILLIILVGVTAGVVGGLLGVGGGTIFVPALILLFGLSAVDAVATSLLAIIPVAIVGALRQRSYGNVRIKEGVLLGVLSLCGTGVGVVISNEVPGDILRGLFAAFLLVIAASLIKRAISIEGDREVVD